MTEYEQAPASALQAGVHHRDVVERKNWVDFPGITLRCSACVKEHAASGRKLCLLKYCDKALGYHAEQKLLRQRP